VALKKLKLITIKKQTQNLNINNLIYLSQVLISQVIVKLINSLGIASKDLG
jgi:hypothetical protein